MKTKRITLYYQVTRDAILPPAADKLERKNKWIREIQSEVEAEWKPTILEVTYRIRNREVERLRKFFNGPVVEYWLIQKAEILEGEPDASAKKRARETILYASLGYEVQLMDGKVERSRQSTADFTDTQEWNDFLQTLEESEFAPNGYTFPDSKVFWENAEKYGYDRARGIAIYSLQKNLKKRLGVPEKPKTYILKVERKNIGKEPGDYYNGEYGSTPEKIQELIEKGIIEEEGEPE
jgi:hypothetical protein